MLIEEGPKILIFQFLTSTGERSRCSVFQQDRYEILLRRDATMRAQRLVNCLGEASARRADGFMGNLPWEAVERSRVQCLGQCYHSIFFARRLLHGIVVASRIGAEGLHPAASLKPWLVTGDLPTSSVPSAV